VKNIKSAFRQLIINKLHNAMAKKSTLNSISMHTIFQTGDIVNFNKSDISSKFIVDLPLKFQFAPPIDDSINLTLLLNLDKLYFGNFSNGNPAKIKYQKNNGGSVNVDIYNVSHNDEVILKVFFNQKIDDFKMDMILIPPKPSIKCNSLKVIFN